jgi:peroxiredoxin
MAIQAIQFDKRKVDKRKLLLGIGAGIALLIAGGLFLLSYLNSEQKPAKSRHLQDAPSFSLKDSEGKSWTREALAGKVVLIHFWAAWCAPCLDEIPKWSVFASTFEGNPDVKFVAISLDPSWREANAVLAKTPLPATVLSLLDPEQKTSEAFGSFQFPETYLMSRDGKILMKWVGPQNWENPLFRSSLELALQAGK